MEKVQDRFLRYVRYDTQSDETSESVPSTPGQLDFARILVQELADIGADDVKVSEYGYVTASIPASPGMKDAPVIGFIAHMDTSPDASGKNIIPRLQENYGGEDIVLNADKNIILRVSEYEELMQYRGCTLIVSDGTTLLGADDKAGVAEIMTAAERLIHNTGLNHGKIRIAFTPDEEIGHGTDHFNVKEFGAAYAYTVDGGAFGTIEYENFNAASAKIIINGISIHPGSAKNKMVNASEIAMEFNGLLPQNEQPQYTQNYEGFWHLNHMKGRVEHAELSYIIRDHDMKLLERRKRAFYEAAEFLNKKYRAGTVCVDIKDSYYNMKKIIDGNFHLIEKACASVTAVGGMPKIIPVRGGTDGAQLSFMGLPCPNIGTGGHNFHGRYEYIAVESMEKTVEQLIKLTELFAHETESI